MLKQSQKSLLWTRKHRTKYISYVYINILHVYRVPFGKVRWLQWASQTIPRSCYAGKWDHQAGWQLMHTKDLCLRWKFKFHPLPHTLQPLHARFSLEYIHWIQKNISKRRREPNSENTITNSISSKHCKQPTASILFQAFVSWISWSPQPMIPKKLHVHHVTPTKLPGHSHSHGRGWKGYPPWN